MSGYREATSSSIVKATVELVEDLWFNSRQRLISFFIPVSN